MKICYVCNEYPPAPHGGIGTFVHTIAHAMREAGHDLTVVGWGGTARVSDDCGVRVVTLPECRTRLVAFWVNRRRLSGWLNAEVRAGRLELIETPDFNGLLPFAFPACPVVVRLHNTATLIAAQAGRKAPASVRWCERQTLRRHRNWVAVSRFIAERTEHTFGLRPVKQAVIYNPVVVPPASGDTAGTLPARFIFHAGKVSADKGAMVLAEAAREVLPEFPDLHLVYAGPVNTDANGPADAQIKNILGPALAARVQFLGPVLRGVVLDCMRRAEVFAFPSRIESLGIVVLEAMASGTPAIYTRDGPGPEVIEDGVTGLLADHRDAAAIARSIKRLLSDKVLARQLTANAQEAVRTRFAVARCVAETERFYRKVQKEQP